MKLMARIAVLISAAFVAVGCGAPEPIEISAGAGSVESCNNADDLRVGLPLSDYDRAEKIADLVAAVDVVLQGTLDNARWTPIEGGDPGDGTILVTIGESSPLTPASPEVPQSVQLEIGANSNDGNPHPLADPLVFPEQTQFIAFAYVSADDPGTLQLHPQGLYLRCETEDQTLESEVEAILEPLPSDASDLMFFELVDTISAVAPPKPDRPVGEIVSVDYRVLADGLDMGEPWSAQVVKDADALVELAPDVDADVDFETEVVFALNPAESGSCPFGPIEALSSMYSTGFCIPWSRWLKTSEVALTTPTLTSSLWQSPRPTYRKRHSRCGLTETNRHQA